MVQIVGSDEVKADAISVGADPLDDDRLEAGLRVSSEVLRAEDLERVLRVSGSCSHDNNLWGF